MTLSQWAENGWLKSHKTSSEEVKNLLAVVERELSDAEKDISSDAKFSHA